MLDEAWSSPAVAEISLTTGSVDVKQADSKDWVAVKEASRVPLTAHARIRTQRKSLCEIHTKSEAVVRLNQETELVLHRPERVELVAGELWCRAPTKAGMEIGFWVVRVSIAEQPDLHVPVVDGDAVESPSESRCIVHGCFERSRRYQSGTCDMHDRAGRMCDVSIRTSAAQDRSIKSHDGDQLADPIASPWEPQGF